MRFLVVGAGSVGGYVGGRLVADGNEVVFMERDRVSVDLLANGLRIETKEKAIVVEKPEIYTDPESAGFFDVILVCVRVPETESVINAVRPLLSFDCAVISLQSGVDAMYRLREALGEQHVLAGFLQAAVDHGPPSMVRELDPEPHVYVGEFGGGGSWRLDCIQIGLESAGFTVTTGENILIEQWRNFILDAALASTAVNTGVGVQQILRDPEGHAGLCDLLAEGIIIADAEDIAVKKSPEELLSTARSCPDEIWLHMRRDMEAGRPIENGALAGSLSRRAEELGIAAPLWARLYEDLKSRAPGSSPGRNKVTPPARGS